MATGDELSSVGPVGPLHGVPITVKDWIDVAGLPCTGGWIESRDRIPTRDATLVDVLISPAVMSVAPPHREMDWADYIFTVPVSLTGAPAAVVPVGKSEGLPVAVQVSAPPWADHIALQVAAALEAR